MIEPFFTENGIEKSVNLLDNTDIGMISASELIHNNNGSLTYKYIKKPGEGKVSLEEIKKRF